MTWAYALAIFIAGGSVGAFIMHVRRAAEREHQGEFAKDDSYAG